MTTPVEDTPQQEIVPSVSEDAVMDESEETKAARAVKQRLFSSLFHPHGESSHIHLAVEFYFADSNLPFDKCEAIPSYSSFL